jgi:hypothetical protein
VSELQRAMALAAAADVDELRRAYWLAVAEGEANTVAAPVSERGLGALRLLTLSALRLPDLALQAQLLDLSDDLCPIALDCALDAAWGTVTGALRLAHRALEAHAEAIGYGHAAWLEHALAHARRALIDLEPASIEGVPAPTGDQVRRVAVAISRAAAATADDVMCVPDEIATALGHLLALFMVISEAIAG